MKIELGNREQWGKKKLLQGDKVWVETWRIRRNHHGQVWERVFLAGEEQKTQSLCSGKPRRCTWSRGKATSRPEDSKWGSEKKEMKKQRAVHPRDPRGYDETLDYVLNVAKSYWRWAQRSDIIIMNMLKNAREDEEIVSVVQAKGNRGSGQLTIREEKQLDSR